MSRLIIFVLLIAASALALGGFARAQQSEWEWRPVNDEWALLRNGRQVGAIRADGAYFRYHGHDVWDQEPSDPPTTPPAEARKKCGCSKGCSCKSGKCGCKAGSRCNDGCKCSRVIGDDEAAEALRHERPNFGVDWSKVSDGEKISVNGREVTRAEAEEAMAGGASGTVPDDSTKLSLTLIGSEDECRLALDGLRAAEFAQLRERAIVQEYRPDDVMINARYWGGKTDGHPTIYLEAPDGKVYYRADSYEGPQTWEAIRKADPSYDPAKDPPRKGSPSSDEGGVSMGVIVTLIVLFLAFAGFAFMLVLGVVFFAVRRRRAAA